MPDLNGYHAFNSTSSGEGGGLGCSTPFWIIIAIIAVLALLGECSA